MTPLEIAPGICLWRGLLGQEEQKALVGEVLAREREAPFYRAEMPGTGAAFSVEMTNFGVLGWLSNRTRGYHYAPTHPVTGAPWPEMPPALFQLWDMATGYPAPPECCLVNLYRGVRARMGLHADTDEEAMDAPVLSISLGDRARFRLGGLARRDPTRSFFLESGDVLTMGGPARTTFHGLDRIVPGTSALVPGGGRLNLTLRRVTRPKAAATGTKKDARSVA